MKKNYYKVSTDAFRIESEYLLSPEDDEEFFYYFKDERQENYFYYLESDFWQNLREQRLKKDNYKCISCGSEEKLQVHHLSYKKRLSDTLDNVVTVCEECHERQHR